MKNSLSLLVVAFDNREEYIQKINNLGVKTSSAYRGNRWFFMRTMRRIWFYCHLPFKSIWYNKQLKNIQYENVIIYDAGITLSFLSWFRANTQVQNVYFVYLNIVSTTLVKPDARVRALCNRIITFDYDEAIKYNIFFDKGGYPLAWTREKRTPLWDIIFVGRDKGRLDKLLILKHEFERYNLKTYFHIVGNRNYFNYNSKYKYKYNNYISYDEYLSLASQTKSVLVFLQDGQSGIEPRVYEALFNKIKIITNISSIKYYDFYNNNNIFILSERPMCELTSFLESPYVDIDADVLDTYDYFSWLRRIIL